MLKKFKELSKLVKIIVLLIPFVNWIVELVIRWDEYLKDQGNTTKLICALFVTIFGMILGWVDLIWVLFFDTLFLLD